MQISTFIDEFEYKSVRISGNVSYVPRTVIERNVQLINREFDEPQYADGTYKTFYPVSYIMAQTLYRNTDIDTKDVNMKATNLASVDKVALLKPAVRAHMRIENFANEINLYRQELIDQGHVIVKQVNGETKLVNLLNIVRPPHVMDLQDSGLVERTTLSWQQILQHKEDWAENWDMIEQLKEAMDARQKNVFEVLEWWKEDEFEVKGKKKFTKGCVKYLDITILEPEDDDTIPSNWNPHIELERFATPESEKINDKSKLKKLRKQGYLGENEDEIPIYPYEEERMITIQGRWNGMGVYELTEQLQEVYNKIMNSKERFDEMNHRGIMLHRQPSDSDSQTFTQEMIQSLDTGGILSVSGDEDLERLNLGTLVGDFIASADKIFELARQVVGITAQGTGEELPSSTTATIGVINAKNAKTTYDIVNEQQGIFLEKLFRRFKLKQIIENLELKDWVELEGDPRNLDELEENHIRNLTYRKVVEGMKSGATQNEVYKRMEQGLSLSEAQDSVMADLESAILLDRQRKPQRFAQLKKEFLEGIEYQMEFYITNESFDFQTRVTALQTMLNNPMTTLSRAKIEEEILDLMNLSGRRFRKTKEEEKAEAERFAAVAPNTASGLGAQPQAPVSPGQSFGNNVTPQQ